MTHKRPKPAQPRPKTGDFKSVFNSGEGEGGGPEPLSVLVSVHRGPS